MGINNASQNAISQTTSLPILHGLSPKKYADQMLPSLRVVAFPNHTKDVESSRFFFLSQRISTEKWRRKIPQKKKQEIHTNAMP